jgi:Arc/MetJ family transcription regulator
MLRVVAPDAYLRTLRKRVRRWQPPLSMCMIRQYYVYQFRGDPMRTNIVIDDTLMAATLKATGLKTKREAVEQGLRTLLRLKQQTELRKLRGKYEWDGDLDTMRRDR